MELLLLLLLLSLSLCPPQDYSGKKLSVVVKRHHIMHDYHTYTHGCFTKKQCPVLFVVVVVSV